MKKTNSKVRDYIMNNWTGKDIEEYFIKRSKDFYLRLKNDVNTKV